jgi:hypothetical protein
MTWIILALLAALAAYFILRARGAGPTASAERAAPAAVAKPVAAASRHWGKRLVVDRPDACAAARRAAGGSYTLAEAPHLPLPGCDNVACGCRFEHLVERRSGTERRNGEDRREDARFDAPPDRRGGQHRRRSDHYEWDASA